VKRLKSARLRISLVITSFTTLSSSSMVFSCVRIHLLTICNSPQTVGVIFKTEHDSFRVLDQNGQVRLVQPHQISMRRDSRRAIAVDSEGHELHPNDNVKETDGEVEQFFSHVDPVVDTF
jgi:transcription elongation factor